MSKIEGNLAHRCKHHDWESIEPREILERLGIVKEFVPLTLKEMKDIFEKLEPRTVATILGLVKAFKGHRDA